MNDKLKIAIVFRGGFSTTGRSGCGRERLFNSKIKLNNFKDMQPCARSVLKNIVRFNNNKIDFDFYIHSWTPQLKERFEKYYTFKNALFEYQENNTKHGNTQFWQALTIQKSLSLIQDSNNYNLIILLRPDIIINKPVDLTETLNSKRIYGSYTTDDMLFVFHPSFIPIFSSIYDKLMLKELPASPHGHIKLHLSRNKCKINSLNRFKGISPLRPHHEIILINRFNLKHHSIIKIQSLIRTYLILKT
tara:strand:- start:362 stop:1102 length:741 start_codon:yes stop_codon:yes gene_type:complete